MKTKYVVTVGSVALADAFRQIYGSTADIAAFLKKGDNVCLVACKTKAEAEYWLARVAMDLGASCRGVVPKIIKSGPDVAPNGCYSRHGYEVLV